MNLREIEWEDVDWMHSSGYGPVAGSCEYGDIPSGSIKGRGIS
jgi:hypothetical protein